MGAAETFKRTGPDQLRILIRVYDFAHVDRDVLQSGENLTTGILHKAGIGVVWLDRLTARLSNAEVVGPEFRLNIVPRLEMLSTAQAKSKDDLLGFAIPCGETDQACLFYVLYSRISAWAGRDGTDPSRIIGHVMAHEIGHALLGPHAHAPTGIMQSRLPRLDMGRVLYFSDVQSQHLRADLVGRIGALNGRLREQNSIFGFIPSAIEGPPAEIPLKP